MGVITLVWWINNTKRSWGIGWLFLNISLNCLWLLMVNGLVLIYAFLVLYTICLNHTNTFFQCFYLTLAHIYALMDASERNLGLISCPRHSDWSRLNRSPYWSITWATVNIRCKLTSASCIINVVLVFVTNQNASWNFHYQDAQLSEPIWHLCGCMFSLDSSNHL